MAVIKTLLLCFMLLYSGDLLAKKQATIVYCTYPEQYNGKKVSLTASLSDGSFQVVEAEVTNNTAIFSLVLQEPCPAYILSEDNTSELHIFLDVPYIEIVMDKQNSGNSLVYESKSTKNWINAKNGIMNWNVKKDSFLNEKPDFFNITPKNNALIDSLNRILTEYIIHEIQEYPDNPVSWYLFRRYENMFSYKQISDLIRVLKHFSGYKSFAVISQKLDKSVDAKTYKSLSLTSINGGTVRLGNLKSKYILIEFSLASSLLPDSLHHELMPLYHHYRHKDLEIVSVVQDYMIRNYLEKMRQTHLPWTLLLSDASISDIDSTLGFARIPGNILLDSNFKVVLRDADIQEVTSFLKAGL